MKPRIILSLMLFTMAMAVAFSAGAQDALGDLLAHVPTQNTGDSEAVSQELPKLGPRGIQDLCKRLVPMGTADDNVVRYALSGLAKYVTRAGKEAERLMFAQAILAALETTPDPDVKAFLINQLQLAGGEECVAPLSALLADDTLCEPATQALLAIRTPSAAEAFVKALPAAQGARRMTLTKAVGEMRCQAAVPEVLKDAANADRTVRLVALWALANIGDPAGVDPLTKAAGAEGLYERSQGTDLLILYAQRRAEAGDTAACETICRDLLKTRTEPRDATFQCAALSTLVGALGTAAFPDLLAAVDSPNRGLRGAALQLAGTIPGEAATTQWAAKLPAVTPEARAEILRMLAKRGDKAAMAGVIAAMKDSDITVRIAAIDAAARLGGAEAIAPVLATLQAAPEPEVIGAAKAALLRLPTEPMTGAVAAGAVAAGAVPARVAMVEVLAERHAAAHKEVVFGLTKDTDESLRIAAIKAMPNVMDPAADGARVVGLLLAAQTDPERAAAQEAIAALLSTLADPAVRADAVLAALAQAQGAQRGYLLATLPAIGGAKALDAVVADTRNADAAVQQAAFAALTAWQDVAALPALNEAVAKGAPDQQEAAMAAVVRLVESGARPAEEKARLYEQAMKAAVRPEEKKVVIGALAGARCPAAAILAASCLNDEAIKTVAARAIIQIVCPADDKDPGLSQPEIVAPLKGAVAAVDDADLRAKGEKHLAAIAPETAATPAGEEGFVPLFNGKDLTGWVGDTAGYVPENGALVCKPGGNLYTDKDYADFVLRFEFKLTPGANNGLAIRAPVGGWAFNGMELQILDNTADQYKELQPYQYHGSIYGIVPAKREFLKPVGEWNQQEVTAKGRRITVVLNGTTIVDADLDEALKDGPMDHKEHLGLDAKAGRIGFLGHGSVLEFRNIRVKELK